MTGKVASARSIAFDPLSPEQFQRFRDLIEKRCGVHFDASQRASLDASLRARMEQLGLARIDDYHDQLRRPTSEEEFRKLINLVTVTETCFFRDPSQFRLIRRHILPTLLASREGGRPRMIRIWSAGCSSGAEAYSIALMLSDMGLLGATSDWRFEIVGSDVNTEVLDTAIRGVYSARALRNIESGLQQRYFRPEGRRFRLNDEIRRAVRFEYANLTQGPRLRPAGGHDLVLCKNVAIYFRPESVHHLVRHLQGALSEGGFLLLGHSESLWQMDEGFSLVEHEGAFCYRKTATRAATAYRRGQKPHRMDARAISPAVPTDATSGEYDRCLAAFRAEQWTAAEALLDTLIRSSPAFVPARLLLGGVYVHRGRYDEAFAQAEEVLRLDRLEPRAHLLLGMIAARRGIPEEAKQALRRALYLDNDLALAHFWLGNLYRDQGETRRACIEYGSVVRGWQRHTLELTDMFAHDLSAEELVDFCQRSLQRLATSDGQRP